MGSFRDFPAGGRKWRSLPLVFNLPSPSPTNPLTSKLPHQRFILPTKQFIFSCNHCSCMLLVRLKRQYPKIISVLEFFNKVSKWIFSGGWKILAYIINKEFIFTSILIYTRCPNIIKVPKLCLQHIF